MTNVSGFPLMSVAIPAYNHARYITTCLESITAQTYPTLEIVLVDDGSQDDTFLLAKQFLESHQERFSRLVLYSRKNRGVSVTSNECIDQCRGEWVHLIGSDDRLYPDKIMRQWQAWQSWHESAPALIYADCDCIDNQGEMIPAKSVSNAQTGKNGKPSPGLDLDAYRWLLHSNHIPNPTVALRREAFWKIGGFDESLSLEDWDCWLRLSVKYPMVRIPEILASYRLHSTNTNKNQAMMLEAMFLTSAKFFRQHQEIVQQNLSSWGYGYRKQLRRYWRWALRHQKRQAFRIGYDALLSYFRAPTDLDYDRHIAAIANEKYF